MSSIQSTSPESVASQRDAFVERFLQSAAGTFSLFSIYIGDRLGLYRALAEGGPATSAGLAGSISVDGPLLPVRGRSNLAHDCREAREIFRLVIIGAYCG